MFLTYEKNIYTYILTATLILHGDYTSLRTPTPHSLKKRDGGTKWSISTEDWTNPHGPIMSLEEHTAEVMIVGGIQGDSGGFTGNKPPSVESCCWIKV